MGIQIKLGMVCVLAARLATGSDGPSQSGPGGQGSPGGPAATQVALRVPNEMAPPGGVVQMKFMVTEPTPISSGGPRFAFDSTFDAVWGIELFNPTGDVNGAAVINSSQVNVLRPAPTARIIRS
jgi:hypothetical protein